MSEDDTHGCAFGEARKNPYAFRMTSSGAFDNFVLDENGVLTPPDVGGSKYSEDVESPLNVSNVPPILDANWTEDDLARAGLHPYWMLLTRAIRNAIKLSPTPDRSDGRIYVSVGRTSKEDGDPLYEALTDNIEYSFGHGCIELRKHMKFDVVEFSKFLHQQFQLRGMSAILECLMKWRHCIDGSQFVVDMDVTNDLHHTDLEKVNIADIPFVSDSIEFFFEDPTMPTVLMHKGKLSDLCRSLGVSDVYREDAGDRDAINFWVETKGGAGFCFRANETNWDSLLYASNAEIPNIGGASMAFTEDEWAHLQPLFISVIKVCVFASIPHYTEVITGAKKKSYPRGGKPGIRKRPQTKSMRVVYLPEVKIREAGEALGGKRNFAGRRGHLRFYRHKRFKKSGLQNTWVFISPTPGPNGEIPSAIYKVRKPKPKPNPIAPQEGRNNE